MKAGEGNTSTPTRLQSLVCFYCWKPRYANGVTFRSPGSLRSRAPWVTDDEYVFEPQWGSTSDR
jgi:hypothetical protein